MKRIVLLLCASLLICLILAGCMQKAADDTADAASTAMSEVEDRADEYGTVSDGDGRIEDRTDVMTPTAADMEDMIDNGVIDDENDDDYDGDNIDDDALSQDDADSGDSDGGAYNAETMNGDGSNFI